MTFSEMLRSEKPVLVDFSAEWCGPCRMLAPILENVKKQIGDQVTIYKLDVDRNPAIASSFNVMSVPTLIVFQHGKPVWRRSGLISANELTQTLQSFVNPVSST